MPAGIKSVLPLFIDGPGVPGGISVELCSLGYRDGGMAHTDDGGMAYTDKGWWQTGVLPAATTEARGVPA